MTYIRKYNIALVAAFLCVVLVFAFAYNMSVKQMLTGTVEENREFAAEYGLKQVPALIIKSADTYEKYIGVAEIKSFLA